MLRRSLESVIGVSAAPLTLVATLALSSTAGAGVCDTGLVCPAPSESHSCVAGQIFDMESSQPVRAPAPAGAPCAEVTAYGPCSIELRAYEALGFFQNPVGTPHLPGEVMVDDCGRFMFTDFPTPALGFAAFTADDAEPNERLVLSASPTPIGPEQTISGFPLYAMLSSTDEAWTSSAGDPFGDTTFAEKGVVAAMFLTEDTPVSGVVATRDPDGVVPADDFYFSDISPLTRSSVDALQNATGVNGTALMVNSALTNHSGQGNIPGGCYWPAMLTKSLPGAVVVTGFHSRDASTEGPCRLTIFSDGFEGGNTEGWSAIQID